MTNARQVALGIIAALAVLGGFLKFRRAPAIAPNAPVEAQATPAGKKVATRSIPPKGVMQPPRFEPAHPAASEEGLTTDPTDAEYDPTALMHAHQMRASELFARETRVDSWARVVEQKINVTLAHDYAVMLPDRTFDVTAECRTSTCMVKIVIPPNLSVAETMAIQGIPQWAGLGSGVQGQGIKDGILTMAYTISKERRDQAEFDRTLAANREQLADKIRAAGDISKAPPSEREYVRILSRYRASID
jgi:hypothetical protein